MKEIWRKRYVQVPPRHPRNRLRTLTRFSKEWLDVNLRNFDTEDKKLRRRGGAYADRFSERFSTWSARLLRKFFISYVFIFIFLFLKIRQLPLFSQWPSWMDYWQLKWDIEINELNLKLKNVYTNELCKFRINLHAGGSSRCRLLVTSRDHLMTSLGFF